jgi:pyridoxine kinase
MPDGIVISIASHVARGSVGNRAMVFALERLGFETWAVPTIVLPHHPGHGRVDSMVPDADAFAALLEALVQGERAAEVVGVISGYLASAEQARAVAALVKTVKAARADALYLCDPVIGDTGGLYVRKALAEAIRDELLPLADIATPNAFECVWLAGEKDTDGEAEGEPDLAALARGLPPPVMLVTSAPAMMRRHIGNLLVTEHDAILFEHPLLSTPAKGTGDLLAALFLARRLVGQSLPKAAETALSSVFEIVARTAKAGADELMLAELQDSIVAPHATVVARRLAIGLRR